MNIDKSIFDYNPDTMMGGPSFDNVPAYTRYRTPESERIVPPAILQQQQHYHPTFAAFAAPAASTGGIPEMLPSPPQPPIRATSSMSWFSGNEDYFDSTIYPAMKLTMPSPNPTSPVKKQKKRKSSSSSSTSKSPKKQRATGNIESGGEGKKSIVVSSKAEGKSTKPVSKKKHGENKTRYDPRSIDVNCILQLGIQKDSLMREGTLHYKNLVDEKGLQLSKDEQVKKWNSQQLQVSTFKYSTEIVNAVRERGGRFLFKKSKADMRYYDIGDSAAIKKTRRLLDKYIVRKDDPNVARPDGEDEMKTNNDNGKQAVGTSPDMDEFARQMKNDEDHLKAGDVLEVLTIPTKHDPMM